MLDPNIAQRLLGGNEILAAQGADGTVTIKDETGKETKLSRDKVLAEACRFCTHRVAPVYDIAVGDLPEEENASAADDSLEEFLKRSVSERWEQFCSEISKCVFCKACQSACPNCYCKTCFADQTRPDWMGAGDDLRDLIVYHLGRIFHQAGRCVDCGACVRACSKGVDLRTFTYKLVKDAEDLFDYTAGLDLEQAPMLLGFSAGDPEGFITEPE
jgi:ferredoxin